jgi:hypothetical protein
MRLLVLGLFICGTVTNVVSQCPIQPREASSDASGKNVTIRYYNSDTRLVRDVQFVLTAKDTDLSGLVLANFSARAILHPKQERTAAFPNIRGTALNGSFELQVKRVSFADRSTWAAPQKNTCRVMFTER